MLASGQDLTEEIQCSNQLVSVTWMVFQACLPEKVSNQQNQDFRQHIYFNPVIRMRILGPIQSSSAEP